MTEAGTTAGTDWRRPPRRWRAYLPWIVAAAFTVSGIVHLAHPATFTRIVPHFLPARTAIVVVSGVAELICAAGLWRRDRWAGWAAAALLVAIWPANLQDAITAQHGDVLRTQVVDWVRLPLQVPLIWFALQSGRWRRVGHRQPTGTGRARSWRRPRFPPRAPDPPVS